MCRNIKTLFNFAPPVTEDEIKAASLQFVRKITGFNKPSQANEGVFQSAVDEVAAVSARLLFNAGDTCPAEEPRGRSREGACARRGAVWDIAE